MRCTRALLLYFSDKVFTVWIVLKRWYKYFFISSVFLQPQLPFFACRLSASSGSLQILIKTKKGFCGLIAEAF
jgi:hypothetical protein